VIREGTEGLYLDAAELTGTACDLAHSMTQQKNTGDKKRLILTKTFFLR
jgi:hypothetical protein